MPTRTPRFLALSVPVVVGMTLGISCKEESSCFDTLSCPNSDTTTGGGTAGSGGTSTGGSAGTTSATTGGSGGTSVQVNHLTVGRIPGGAIIQSAPETPMPTNGTLTFALNDPDFTTANRVVQAINALGLDSDALLVGNGVQGNLRINATTGDVPVQPFIYGGVAWRRYQLSNTSENTSDVIGEDDVLEVPLGIGVAYKIGGMMLDARLAGR